MIGRTNACSGGGGGGLNFRIIGNTSAPSAPKENDIWANTDIGIPVWAFSAEQPWAESGDAVEGALWISTAATSPVAFNALKKNAINVYPSGVKQYVDGAWVSVDAKIYQAGNWVQFSTVWDGTLFDNGEQYVSITGGWTETTGNTLESSFWSNQTFGTPVSTNKKVRLDGYNTLNVTFTSVTKAANFGVSEVSSVSIGDDFNECKQVNSAGT